jgi:hypothetical protein
VGSFVDFFAGPAGGRADADDEPLCARERGHHSLVASYAVVASLEVAPGVALLMVTRSDFTAFYRSCVLEVHTAAAAAKLTCAEAAALLVGGDGGEGGGAIRGGTQQGGVPAGAHHVHGDAGPQQKKKEEKQKKIKKSKKKKGGKGEVETGAGKLETEAAAPFWTFRSTKKDDPMEGEDVPMLMRRLERVRKEGLPPS